MDTLLLSATYSCLSFVMIVFIWYLIIKYKFSHPEFDPFIEEVLSKVQDLIILIDTDLNIVKVNDRVLHILGYEANNLNGKNLSFILDGSASISDFLLPDIISCQKINTVDRVDFKNSTNNIEMNLKTVDNKLIPINIAVAYPLSTVANNPATLGGEISDANNGNNDELVAIVLVACDLSMTRQLEQEVDDRIVVENELLEINEKLKEVDKLKTDFLSAVSHELRMPLTAVLGFSKLIKRRLKGVLSNFADTSDIKIRGAFEKIEGNLDIIILEVERLTYLINDALDIAKMEAGEVEWKVQSVSVKDVILRAISSVESLAEQKKLKIYEEIEDNLPKIEGDMNRLIQVIINLLSNAIKFTDSGGVIICRAVASQNELMVSVIDDGVGIAKEDKEKIFEKFSQGGNILTNKPHGTGLGLSICKQIIEHHHGRIWVESEAGKGSNFSFAIPIKGAFGQDRRMFDIYALLRILKEVPIDEDFVRIKDDKMILIIDNDESIREILKEEIISSGYCCVTARDGIDGMNCIRNVIPALIILDIMMRKISGYDFIMRLKENPETRHIPIIVLSVTEYDRQYDRFGMDRLGMDRYFNKPVNLSNLLAEIETILFEETFYKNILVIDGEDNKLKALTQILRFEGFSRVNLCGVSDCADKTVEFMPDIIIVDAEVYAQNDVYNKINSVYACDDIKFFLIHDEG